MAKLIDTAIWVVAIILYLVLFNSYPYRLVLLMSWVILISILAIQVVLLSKDGQTMGKKALHIRIVNVSTGQSGGFVPNVLLRAWLNFLIEFIPFYLLFDVLFIFREDRRCIHDLIARTRVIQ